MATQNAPDAIYRCNNHSHPNKYDAVTWHSTPIAEFQIAARNIAVFGVKMTTNILAGLRCA